jgi:uncharacterized cupin superfamily protein
LFNLLTANYEKSRKFIMQALKQSLDLSGMTSVGSICNLGSEVLEGDPQASILFFDGSPESNLAVGLFGCTKGSFRLVYPFSEHAVVVKGELTLINEESGESENYGPGDGWFIKKGTPVKWTIHSEDFVKHYLSIVQD